MTPAVCGALALAALGAGFGLAQWLYTRRLLARLDRMLADAVDGSFRESRFDESRSALEGRLARFLNGSAASARELEGKRAAIQTLISDISHQTKTPIANILLYASLLAEGELSPEQAAQAATLSRQAEKLSFLIQALVKASRLETGIITTAPEPQPVGPLLEGALAQARPQAEAKGLTLAAEPCGAAARFDRKWTAEALFNVVDNAVKYTPAGGRVTLSAVPLGQFCRLDVSDTGIGIPEEEQGRIFGRFYRGGAVRAEEGVGIGLYLVREILRRQGGYVKVASHPGQGTDVPIVRGKYPAKGVHNLPGGFLEISCPAVIAQPLPQLHQLVLRSRRQILYRGKSVHELGKIPQHRRHAGLLQHDLRHPHPIGGGLPPPGQVPGMFPIPLEQGDGKKR